MWAKLKTKKQKAALLLNCGGVPQS
jgi:hypothetical protein